MGCRIELDDCGSGARSFWLLKRFRVVYLKMAHAVTAGVVAEGADRAVVAAIKQVAEGHGALCCAKSAECVAAVVVLRDLGFDFAQGYSVSPLLLLRMGEAED